MTCLSVRLDFSSLKTSEIQGDKTLAKVITSLLWPRVYTENWYLSRPYELYCKAAINPEGEARLLSYWWLWDSIKPHSILGVCRAEREIAFNHLWRVAVLKQGILTVGSKQSTVVVFLWIKCLSFRKTESLHLLIATDFLSSHHWSCCSLKWKKKAKQQQHKSNCKHSALLYIRAGETHIRRLPAPTQILWLKKRRRKKSISVTQPKLQSWATPATVFRWVHRRADGGFAQRRTLCQIINGNFDLARE